MVVFVKKKKKVILKSKYEICNLSMEEKDHC
jgi:hypothetical protein